MNSTFTGLSIATRGLYTSQGALAVTSNNISNANTAGYSRQVVNQSAVGPAAVYNGRSFLGAGSQITSVDRVRDFRLDQQYWQESGTLGEWQSKTDSLTEMESVLGEPSSNGFSTVMDNFYSSLEDLSKDPADSSTRASVKEAGVALCSYFNDAASRLTGLRADTNGEVKTTVDEINSYSRQIAALNDRIRVASAAGASTNDLADQQALLIDKLSALVKVDASETVVGKQADGSEDKVVTLSVAGSTLVVGGQARQLATYEITDGSAENGMYGIKWQDTGDAFTPGGGSLKAYLDLRDGDGSSGQFQGIPYYSSQLDDFARTFAEAFNEGIFKDGTAYYAGHAGGEGLDGSQGSRFFSFNNNSSADLMASGTDTAAVYANITAANISLSQDVEDNTDKIAAASTTGGAGNNDNINALIALTQDSRMFNSGTPEDFMNSIISTLGTGSAYAQQTANGESAIVKNISDRRASVSGVSTNEETASLTAYQQAYEASAKVISTWNTVYQDTINMVLVSD